MTIKQCMKCGYRMALIYSDIDIQRYSCQDEKCGQIEDMHSWGATLCPNDKSAFSNSPSGLCVAKECFDSDGEWHWYYCTVRP
jgi:hypothetical protein